MKRHLWIGLPVVLFSFCATVSFSQEIIVSKPPPPPEASDLIRKFSERLKTAKHFQFRVVDTIDDVRDDGLMIQHTHVREVIVSQPDRMKYKTIGDVSNRTLWKDGKTVTIYDADENVYAQVESTGTIDEMLDALLDKYGFSLPVADLLSSDVHEAFTKSADSTEMIGIGLVGDVPCHHLVYRGDGIDWQLWFGAEDTALKKMVITYNDLPGRPRYTMRVLEVNLMERPEDVVFEFKPPAGAEKIEIEKQNPSEPAPSE